MRRLEPDIRKKIYFILAFVSLIFLFLAVRQAKWVIVEPEAPLGLVSYLPVTYWIGLAVVMITAIMAVLDRELKKDSLFIVLLVVIALHVSGVAVFVQENAAEPDAYTHFPGGFELLTTNHLDISTTGALESYNSWPVYHFLSAAMVAITDVGFALVKYVPLVWLLFLALVAYGTGRRFGVAPNYCFLISSIAVLSFWIGVNEYTPRLLGMILLLSIFMMVLNSKNSIGEHLALMLLFSALVMTHGTSSIAAIFAVTLVALYKKEPLYVIFFVIVFTAWQVYVTPLMFESGTEALRNTVLNIFEITRMENYQGAASTGRLIARYSQLGYLVIYAISMLGVVFFLLTKRITGQHKKQVLTLFAWIVGTAAILLVGAGNEVYRTYIFLVVPLACIVCLAFLNWRILVPIMCVFCVLFPMARYSTIASWGQVLTTQLEGVEFWANRINTSEIYFADGYSIPSLVRHYNRDMLTYPYWTPNNISKMGKQSATKALDDIHYIIMSKQGNDGLTLGKKENPYLAWLFTERGIKSDLMYNNGYFQIHINNSIVD